MSMGTLGSKDLSDDSVFFKDEGGQIFHACSTSRHGGEALLSIDRCLDAPPKGRMENGPDNTLADGVRPRHTYSRGGVVEVTGRYQPACVRPAHR